MSRPNSRIRSWNAWLAAPLLALGADLTLAQLSVPKETTLKTAPTTLIYVPPAVSGFQPAGSCIKKGTAITVLGKNFGTQSGKGAALGGQGIHVDLPVSSWSGSSIGVTIPNDSRIQAGKRYYIGIEKSDHSKWLSNIDKTIIICSVSATTLTPLSTPTLQLTSPTAPRTITPTEPSRTAPPTGSRTTPAPEGEHEYEYTDPGQMPALPPPGGGSLLNAELPPPPQDAPPTPVKENAAIEPAELLVVSNNMAEAQQLAAQAQTLRLTVKRRTKLGGLGFVVTVFRVPKGVGIGDTLLALRQTLPNVWADANHRFQLQGDESKTYGQKLLGWNSHPKCGTGLRIGLIDTLLDMKHPMLRGHKIERRDFLTTGSAAAGAEHGTATAALLVGRDVGMVPGAQLYAASVFRRRDRETDATAEWIVLALNWLAENRVAVINLSLGGPRNLLVEAAVQRLLERGVAVVAAAGNGGDDAPPVFPAAQSGVVAVTAVDAKLAPWRRANRGNYIGFAAPGVDVWTAAPGRAGVFVSGTSYAAPFFTAALASARLRGGKQPWSTLIKQLQTGARDLGTAGKDPVFGWGLIQSRGCPARKS